MVQLRYPVLFALAVVALTVGALLAYGRISQASLIAAPSPVSDALAPDWTQRAARFAPASAADYEPFAAEDRDWRERNAPSYTFAELRARGDGRRSPRQALEDRVFRYTQRGERGRAIAELERWVAAHPGDRAALLSLARLLNEAGRTQGAVARYRQLLALEERGAR